MPLVFTALLGCQAAPKRTRPRVALVMKSLANDFFRTMEAGAREHQLHHAQDYELISNGIKDEQDVGKQIDLVWQMVAQGVDALVLAPADSKALVSAVKRAQAAGVVVVNIDNRLDEGVLAEKHMHVPYVGPSNLKGAALAASVVTQSLQAGDKVAIIEGIPTAANARERKAGFAQAISSAKLQVVSSQAGNWDMAKANQITAALLTAHPDLKAIFCANDTMALGAVSALRAAGRLNDVKVAGFDNIGAMSALVKRGDVAATVDQHGDQLAVFGIEYALLMLKGQAAPADKETPVTLISGASAHE
ncbi:MAG: sugar ABC transporter substrate-binding protein [Deltaproteobacteria bacterium]|nr:sugar ABC transporter substrate-binding protein [Deltaproteobacteria bacterium]